MTPTGPVQPLSEPAIGASLRQNVLGAGLAAFCRAQVVFDRTQVHVVTSHLAVVQDCGSVPRTWSVPRNATSPEIACKVRISIGAPAATSMYPSAGSERAAFVVIATGDGDQGKRDEHYPQRPEDISPTHWFFSLHCGTEPGQNPGPEAASVANRRLGCQGNGGRPAPGRETMAGCASPRRTPPHRNPPSRRAGHRGRRRPVSKGCARRHPIRPLPRRARRPPGAAGFTHFGGTG